MSKLREHNRGQLEKWLDRILPVFFPGGYDPFDDYIDDNSRVGQEPLTEGRLAVLDNHAKVRSHDKLYHLFFERLKEEKPRHYFTACYEIILSESSGGYQNLTHLEKHFADNPVISEPVKTARAALEWVLDVLEAEEFWLEFGEDDPKLTREIEDHEKRRKRVEEAYKVNRRKLKSEPRAVARTAAESGYSERQVRRIVENIAG